MNDLDLVRSENWTQLFNVYNPYLFVCCNYDNDLTQDAWLKIYLNKEQFKHGSFKAWISRIADNIKNDVGRKAITKKNKHTKVELTETYNDYIQDDNGFELKQAEDTYLLNKINSTLDQLPIEQKETLVLNCYFDQGKAADLMKVNANTFRGRIRYARNNIKAILKIAA